MTLRFTCGEKKIRQSIKKSQNIMSMICSSDVNANSRSKDGVYVAIEKYKDYS